MSTVVLRSNGNGSRRRRQRVARRRPAARTQPVVVVTSNGPARRGRRRRPVGPRRGRTPRSGGGSRGETFVFSKDSLAGNSSGSITFGPSLSEYPAFQNGVLKAYHEYKITNCVLQFVSEASSTAAGSISYELDPHCKASSLASTINKFTITKTGARSFPAKMINGLEWHPSDEDQFRILYKGNGASSVAGSFKITLRVQLQNPK
nr:coat protein [Cereal yellow dwarf virus RPV]ABP68801.1 coat protein [Cereal yellow dwarf virus RPV]QGT40970.1 coat protein [Cereal yellow dwarf virus RPV]QGT40971.1 coat protein [Cereal yellow dwarf virus RPV]QGT41051.1 coat protein [Cereal yellow dwarf virus RPV]